MSDSTTLQLFPNSTATYFLVGSICQDSTWLTQYKWADLKAYDVILKMADFFDGVEDPTNPPIAAMAEYTGATEHMVTEFLEIIPSWYGYNYSYLVYQSKLAVPLLGHPTANSAQFNGIFALFAILATLFVGLRIWSRLSINGFIRSYDWPLIAAYVVTLGFGTMNAVCKSYR
jgi:hypothetical protein